MAVKIKFNLDDYYGKCPSHCIQSGKTCIQFVMSNLVMDKIYMVINSKLVRLGSET